MSESLRELERVKDSLMAARRAVVIAHGMTEDLHSGVDGAGKSLAESEVMRRYATVAGEGAAAYFDSAAKEMVRVERFCDGAAMVGVQISTELKGAREAVEDARLSLGRIDRAELSAPDVADLAVLQARVDATGEVVDLALPMALAASENLYAASHAARLTHSPIVSVEGGGPPTFETVSMVNRDLGRASSDEVHLERAMERVDVSTERSLSEAEAITGAAEARLRGAQVPEAAQNVQMMSVEGPSR